MEKLQFLTTVEMAQMLGVSPQRLGYFLRSRGIEPAALVGPIRIYLPETLERLRGILQQLEARHTELHPAIPQEMEVPTNAV